MRRCGALRGAEASRLRRAQSCRWVRAAALGLREAASEKAVGAVVFILFYFFNGVCGAHAARVLVEEAQGGTAQPEVPV